MVEKERKNDTYRSGEMREKATAFERWKGRRTPGRATRWWMKINQQKKKKQRWWKAACGSVNKREKRQDALPSLALISPLSGGGGYKGWREAYCRQKEESEKERENKKGRVGGYLLCRCKHATVKANPSLVPHLSAWPTHVAALISEPTWKSSPSSNDVFINIHIMYISAGDTPLQLCD